MNTALFYAVNPRSARLTVFTLLALACWLNPATLQAASTINYVQGNYADPQTPQTTVNVPFTTAAQVAGDLNVVVVGWNDSTATVNTVTDSKGNIYTLAAGPTVITGFSQSIYYAKNIVAAAAGANNVAVTFSVAAAFPTFGFLNTAGPIRTSPWM
jgi:hypothetical protein